MVRPPRLARWLLAFIAPPDQRADLLADFDDEWRTTLEAGHIREASRRYWRQTSRSLGPLAYRRLAMAFAPMRRIDALGQDVRFGARMLRRSPGSTTAAIVALALGIGATTATFSVVNAVLLRPLDYVDPEQLVIVMPHVDHPVAAATLLDWQRQARAFSAMAAAEYWTPNVSNTGTPEQIHALHVTANMLPMLGVTPALGRWSQDGPAGDQEVVIGASLWQRTFGADPHVVGRSLSLDGRPYTIVGVMPASFTFAPFWATRAELWAPMDLRAKGGDRDGESLRVFARLRPGVTVGRAQTEITAIAARLEAAFPGTNQDVVVTPLKQRVIGDVRQPMLLLFGAVAFVLLIACANVAHMLLARSSSRGREVAVRAALGADRGRLVSQFVTESLVLSLAGGALGTALSLWGVRWLASLAGPDVPRISSAGIDVHVLTFVAALSVMTGVIFGLAPALRAAAPDLTAGLRDAERGSSEGRRGGRLRRVLMATEVALAVTLLIGAGLCLRSFAALRAVDPGFVPDHIASMIVSVAGSAESAPGRRIAFYRAAIARMREIPGVASVSAINHLPIAGDMWGVHFAVEGTPAASPSQTPSATYRVVLPNYFSTMHIPLRDGRDFSDRDRQGAPGAVIVNEFLAQHQWPGEHAVGKRLRLSSTSPWLTVVGVSKNAVRGDWTAPPDNEFYLPLLQTTPLLEDADVHVSYMTVVVRATGDPAALASSMRGVVHGLAGDVTVSEFVTMPEVVARVTSSARFLLTLLALFAGVALVLASVGIYGMMSYFVAVRRREIGIRMALGATAGRVLGGVLREGAALAGFGAAAGLIAALLLSRFLQQILYGVMGTDVVILIVVPGLLVVVAVLACYIPARRASRVDPIASLRGD